MPHDYVEKIVALAQPFRPVEQPSPDDWERVERELNRVFPPDFKALVSALGSGTFGLTLELKNPTSSSQYGRLSKAALFEYRALVSFLEERTDVVLFPQPEGIVLVGEAERHHLVLRPDPPGQHLSQLLWLDHDLEKLLPIPMSISRFLHDLYLRKISDRWAAELRSTIWRDPGTPFFTPR